MQKAINTDIFVMGVVETLMQTELWMKQEYLNQVKSVLYMHLQNKTIFVDDQAAQLPAEYVNDTPRIIETWLRCLRLERRTETTIKAYRNELRNLFRYIDKHYADVMTNDVRGYLSWCQMIKHNSDSTINNKYHAFCSFYNWIMSEDTIEDGGCLSRKPKKNPMTKINKVREEKKIRTLLTEEQVEIIRCDCATLRDRAIVEILIATGMRISELVGLNLTDIDIQNKTCIVYGKGRKERPAFFTDRAVVHLKSYLNNRKQMKDCEPALFLNNRKVDGVYTRMSDCSIRKMLKDIVVSDSRLTGLNLHPHLFRAYLATYMARHGATLEEIKNVLGHSNINTTVQCYIIEDVKRTKEAHDRYAA